MTPLPALAKNTVEPGESGEQERRRTTQSPRESSKRNGRRSQDGREKLTLVRVGESSDGGESTVAGLWKDYKANGNREARDRLILHYAPFVKLIAGRLGPRVPSDFDRADLTSMGMLGLIDAIEKFDPRRGIKFETYASRRINGAIVDELRSIDWVPRSVRRNERAIHEAQSNLEHDLRRSPNHAEIASELGTSESRLARMRAEAFLGGLEPLEKPFTGDNNDRSRRATDRAVAHGSDHPVETFERNETECLLADAISSLSDRERLIVLLYYYEGLTLATIGATLKITESRVSQLCTKTLLELRRRLDIPSMSETCLEFG